MRDTWEGFRLFKNVPEISWKKDCEAAFLPLYSDCMGDKSKNNETCEPEYRQHTYLACTPLSPSTKRECLDRFTGKVQLKLLQGGLCQQLREVLRGGATRLL